MMNVILDTYDDAKKMNATFLSVAGITLHFLYLGCGTTSIFLLVSGSC
jgi:hypothetical protein